MKTTGLAVRPMFHWMPQRITAHVKLCVLALMIQRAAEIATGLPWRQLASLLERLKAVRYTSEGQTYSSGHDDPARARRDLQKAWHFSTQDDPRRRLSRPAPPSLWAHAESDVT